MSLVDNLFEVPSWAVAAAGESRLDPICETGEIREPIDLTGRVSYSFGRSPSTNIQLHHRSSSRRHAVMFHHPNGACYLLDCRSGHGTYVNGNRIPPTAPMRVRRGSLIRFGGPGAPCFILKCFSTDLDKLVRDLGNVAHAFEKDRSSSREFWLLQQQTLKSGVACIRGEGGMVCIVDEHDAPTAALVLLNTRLNACGGFSSFKKVEKCLAMAAKVRFHTQMQSSASTNKKRPLGFAADGTSSATKKFKNCTPRSILALHKVSVKEHVLDVEQTTTNTIQMRVSFSDEYPKHIYPTAVTPDILSSESEEEDDETVDFIKSIEAPGTKA